MHHDNFNHFQILHNNFTFIFENILKEKFYQELYFPFIKAYIDDLMVEFLNYKSLYEHDLNTCLNLLLKEIAYLQRSKCDDKYHVKMINTILKIPGFVPSADEIEFVSAL